MWKERWKGKYKCSGGEGRLTNVGICDERGGVGVGGGVIPRFGGIPGCLALIVTAPPPRPSLTSRRAGPHSCRLCCLIQTFRALVSHREDACSCLKRKRSITFRFLHKKESQIPRNGESFLVPLEGNFEMALLTHFSVSVEAEK